ncbi:MAG: hypothetical protein V4697_03760 [Patescibacteria group bacterium]
MKKFILSVVLVLLSLCTPILTSTAWAQGGGGGGGGQIISPGTFEFIYPVTDQVWYPDRVAGIKYAVSNLNGYVGVRLVSEYRSYYLTDFYVSGNGADADAFILYHHIKAGEYRLEASIWDYDTEQNFTWTSSAKITVPSVVVSPKAGEVTRAGKKVRVTLSSPVPPGEIYGVYLQGKGLGQYSQIALEVIKSGKNHVVVLIPQELPNKAPLLSGNDYHIVVRDFSYNLSGDNFTIVNPKTPLPFTFPSGNSGGSSGGGGGVGIAGKN